MKHRTKYIQNQSLVLAFSHIGGIYEQIHNQPELISLLIKYQVAYTFLSFFKPILSMKLLRVNQMKPVTTMLICKVLRGKKKKRSIAKTHILVVLNHIERDCISDQEIRIVIQTADNTTEESRKRTKVHVDTDEEEGENEAGKKGGQMNYMT